MKRKILISGIILISFTVIVFAISNGGTKTDPIVTKNQVETIVNDKINEHLDNKLKDLEFSLEGQIAKEIYPNISNISFVLNDTISNLSIGDKITVRSGTAIMSGTGSLINLSTGVEVASPQTLQQNVEYMVTENSSFDVKVTSLTSKISIDGIYSLFNPYILKYEDFGHALNKLGLFNGTDYGLELNRPASRIESLIMLIRLLGEEEQALAHSSSHNFTDVPSWADTYVAYAFDKGYTKGMTDTLFYSDRYVRDLDYYTFILRALGYKDDIDFTWATAFEKAIEIKIIPETFESKYELFRDDLVFTSFNSLDLMLKDSTKKLYEHLEQTGALDGELYYKIKQELN